jgi:tetratricopeptide (TPR) repeat protein
VTGDASRSALLNTLYRHYLVDQNADDFTRQLDRYYTIGTLQRLATSTRRETRRAAVLALGMVADYDSNAVLGRALIDEDRGVRSLAEDGIVALWRRVGDEPLRQKLGLLVRLNSAQQFSQCIVKATELIVEAPWIAEGWNQRAIAHYSQADYAASIGDCHQALEINPYHFGAASGMGQCYLQLSDYDSALESFRRALRLNPNLEGVRASVAYLERARKGK